MFYLCSVRRLELIAGFKSVANATSGASSNPDRSFVGLRETGVSPAGQRRPITRWHSASKRLQIEGNAQGCSIAEDDPPPEVDSEMLERR